MSKVKIIKRQNIDVQTDLDYPIYLYFQDEDCLDELVKVDEKYAIIVKYSHFGVTIEKTSVYHVEEYYLDKITTREHFEDKLKEALKLINKL